MKQPFSQNAAGWLALAILIAACAETSTSTPQPPIMWRTTQSPVFPSEWPPTAATQWVRYTFAYGNNPTTLVDGVYVTRPLTRTEVQRDGNTGAVTILNTALDSIGIQGVKPLDAASSAALGKGAQMQTLVLSLHALPAEAQAVELRGYYRTWINLNGAFAKQIRSYHPAFFDWLESDR